MSCDISDLNQTALFIELYRQAKVVDPTQIVDLDSLGWPKAKKILEDEGWRGFKVYSGKDLHFHLSGAAIDTSGYNDKNGEGAFEAVVEKLRLKMKQQNKLFDCIKNYTTWNRAAIAAIADTMPEVVDSLDLSYSQNDFSFRHTPLIQVLDKTCAIDRQEEIKKGQEIIDLFLTTYRVSTSVPTCGSIVHRLLAKYDAQKLTPLLEWLLEYPNVRASIDERNAEQRVALHAAVASKNLKAAQLLLQHNACVHFRDKKGNTVFHELFESDKATYDKTNLEFLELLLSSEEKDKSKKLDETLHSFNEAGYTPLHLAIKRGQVDCVKKLVARDPTLLTDDAKDFDHNSIFHLASQLQPDDIAQTMMLFLFSVRSDFDVNTKNRSGRTCMHLAAEPDLKENFNENVLRILFARKADINLADRKGFTLLHQAAQKGKINLIQFLLGYRPNVEQLDEVGFTALDYTRPEILKKTSEDIFSFYQERPEHGEIAALLKAAGAIEVDISTITVNVPANPPAHLVEELRQEVHLQSERDRGSLKLSDIELKQWEEDTKYVKALFSKLETREVYCDSEAEIKALKEKYPNNYYFCEPDSTSDACSVVIFSNPIAGLHQACDAFKALVEEFKEKMAGFQKTRPGCDTTKSYLPGQNIQADIQRYGSNNVLVKTYWLTGHSEMYVFNDLNTEQQKQIQAEQQAWDKYNEQLKRAWDHALQMGANAGQETRHFRTEAERNEFVKSDTLTYPQNYYLLSPTAYKRNWCVTLYQKLSPAEEAALSSRKMWRVEKKKPVLVEEQTTPKRQAKTHPVILKNRLGWELLHQSQKPTNLAHYLQENQAKLGTLSYDIQGVKVEFINLTQADDYRFFVNTVLTRPQRLRELIEGDPKFFEHAPFMSVCLLDKTTRGFAGGHQSNLLFPTYLVLDVPADAIDYAGGTDIGSPYACRPANKIQYLQRTTPTRLSMDWLQGHLQLKRLEQDPDRYLPDPPYHVRSFLSLAPYFKRPQYKNMGSLPLYTVEGLCRDTDIDPASANSYSEGIVKGNAFHPKGKGLRGTLLLVEKYFVERFIAQKHSSQGKDSQAMEESLNIIANINKLTNGRIKLALIETDMQGFKRKPPLLEQFEMLEQEKINIRETLIRLHIQACRCSYAKIAFPEKLQKAQMHADLELVRLREWQQELEFLAKNPPLVTQLKRTQQDLKELVEQQHSLPQSESQSSSQVSGLSTSTAPSSTPIVFSNSAQSVVDMSPESTQPSFSSIPTVTTSKEQEYAWQYFV